MKRPLRSSILMFFFLLAGLVSGPAQQEGNPFELIPRLEREAAARAVDELSRQRGTGNPFDLIHLSAERKAAPAVSARPLRKEERFQRFAFVYTVLSLLMFASLLTLFRGYFQRSLRAFLTDTMLNQAQRDRESGRAQPFFLFYTFFLLNAGLYVFLLIRHNGFSLTDAPFYSYLLCLGAVSGLFLLKHLLVGIVGYVFPVEKEAGLYNFMIVIFGIILGVVLLLLNLLLLYGPDSLAPTVVYLSFFLIGGVYVFRTLRALFMANQYLTFHTFHFLLYICTVEIAPVIAIIKLIIKQL